MRIPVFAANWKMYKTVHETRRASCASSARSSRRSSGVEIVVAPPFTALAAAAEIARNTHVGIAAQDLYFEREGAFTGEVSAAMIKDAGATHVIIGHSERRRLFGDTDEWVQPQDARGDRRRPHADRLHRRNAGGARSAARRSPSSTARSAPALDGLGADQIARAGHRLRAGLGHRHRQERHAGGGRRGPSPHPRPAAPVVRRRGRRRRAASCTAARSSPTTSASSVGLPDVDGALVGGASLDVRSFFEIVTRAG